MKKKSLADSIESGISRVGSDWKKAKRQADKNDRVSGERVGRLRYSYRAPNMKDAVVKYMQDAYNKASGNGRYYANARQIMYAIRPSVMEYTGGKIWKDSSYFTQTLLKDYLE